MTITKEQLQYKLAGLDRHDYDAIMELLADREERIRVLEAENDRYEQIESKALTEAQERIRALEARNTLNSEALQTQNGRACLAEDRERTLQARIERVRGLAEKMKSRWLVREGEAILAALDGETKEREQKV